MVEILGYFMEDEIYFHGVKQPLRKTPIIAIGYCPSFSLDDFNDEDEVPVLSDEENWYTIKKKDIIPVE